MYRGLRQTWTRTVAGGQSFAQRFISTGKLGKSVEQRAQIEPGAAGEDGEMAAPRYFHDGLARGAGVIAGRTNLARIEDVYHVMADTGALGLGNFGGADGESAVELERIAIDDFAVELGGEAHRERAFPGSGGPDDRDQMKS
jgi:hypothetical protein